MRGPVINNVSPLTTVHGGDMQYGIVAYVKFPLAGNAFMVNDASPSDGTIWGKWAYR